MSSSRPGALLAVVLLALLLASAARAEVVAQGGLVVRFAGGISPKALPRGRPVPISVALSGTVRTSSVEGPPPLRRIEIAINRGGRLDAHGLPTCEREEIQPSSSAQAREICGPALVGEGSFDADVAFPEQAAFPSHGQVLAFNALVGCSSAELRMHASDRRPPSARVRYPSPTGRLWPSSSRTQGERGGERAPARDPNPSDRGQRDAPCHSRPAILVQVYGGQPTPTSRIIVFHIRRGAGTYGTVLTAVVPGSLDQWSHLTHFSLELHRDFTYRGRPRSYLSASCPAPAGFPGATFPFARAAIGFADGRTLASTLIRTCRVRG